MSAFTTPSGETLQSLAFYNELQLAYSERRQALGQSAQTLFSENAYWQQLSMYQTWQNWLEANCISFIDHVNGPLNPAGTDFLYFTLATWRTVTGLNASGFSRYDKDGNFIGYGIAQNDDAICANTFDELQKGFGALKKTWVLPSSCNLRYQNGFDFANTDWALSKLAAEANLAASTPTIAGFTNKIYFINNTHSYWTPAGKWGTEIINWQTKPVIDGVSGFIKRSAKIYVITPARIITPLNEAIFDANGMAEVQQDKLSLCGTVALTDSAQMVGDEWYGFPLGTVPTWCNQPPTDGSYNTCGFSSFPNNTDIIEENCGAEISWDFTNA